MVCLKCRTENDSNGKFCRNFGTRLVQICPNCGSECAAEDKFCGECGHNLKFPSTPSPGDLSEKEKLEMLKRYIPTNPSDKILSQRDKIEGERKQVTALFCDIEGFTALSEQLGPEEAYSLMDRGGCR
jgi:predicted amidophosphoribosyltransferase